MLQPLRHIQYTAIINILVITTIMAINNLNINFKRSIQ